MAFLVCLVRSVLFRESSQDHHEFVITQVFRHVQVQSCNNNGGTEVCHRSVSRVGQLCSVLCGFTGTSRIRASDGSFYSTENIRKSSHAVMDNGLLLEINQPKFIFAMPLTPSHLIREKNI